MIPSFCENHRRPQRRQRECRCFQHHMNRSHRSSARWRLGIHLPKFARLHSDRRASSGGLLRQSLCLPSVGVNQGRSAIRFPGDRPWLVGHSRMNPGHQHRSSVTLVVCARVRPRFRTSPAVNLGRRLTEVGTQSPERALFHSAAFHTTDLLVGDDASLDQVAEHRPEYLTPAAGVLFDSALGQLPRLVGEYLEDLPLIVSELLFSLFGPAELARRRSQEISPSCVPVSWSNRPTFPGQGPRSCRPTAEGADF